MQGLAGGDNVVHDEYALALHQLRIGNVDNELLNGHGGDGLDCDLENAAHVSLGTLAGEEVLLGSALAGHLVEEGNGLGFGCDDVIVFGGTL